MNKVTFFSTSKPVIDKKTDMYPNIISNSIESELRGADSNAKVIVRKTINRLFQKDSLSSST